MRYAMLYCCILLFAFQGSVKACDACACGISGTTSGPLANYKNNYLGFTYQSFSFYNHLINSDESADKYHLFNIQARWELTDRVRLIVRQPYRVNERQAGADIQQVSGLGDLFIQGSYKLFNLENIDGSTSFLFELGGGLKLPTGKYDPDIHLRDLPENFNIGNGSWGYSINPVMIFKRNRVGAIMTAVYQLFSSASNGYEFGDQAAVAMEFSYTKNLGMMSSLTPGLGLYFESNKKDYYDSGLPVHGTGGNGLFLTFSNSVRVGKMLVIGQFIPPITADYSDSEVKARSRWTVSVNYILN